MRPQSLLIALAVAATSGPVGAQERLTLGTAVDAALGYHPQIQMARAATADGEAALRQARAGNLPSFTVEGSVVRFQEPMIVAPLHAFDPLNPPSFAETLVQSEWTASYTLFDGGARGAGVSAARASLGAISAAGTSAEMSLIARVSEVYLQILSAREVDSAAGARVASIAAEVERTGRLLAEGRVARVQLLRAEAALANARAERVSTGSNLTALVNELGRLTGFEPDARTLTPVTLRSDPFRGRSATPVAPEDNPAVVAATQMVSAAEARAGAARGSRLPTLSLLASVVTFGSTDGGFSGEWRGGLGIRYPLFTGGARGGAIQSAEAGAWRAREELRNTTLEVESQLDRALVAIGEIDARIGATEQAVAHLTEVTRIELLALEAGAGVQTDYLTAESDLFGARAALSGLRHRSVAARVRVAALTGDLSPEWLDTYLEIAQ